jgi:hypothetical protein
MLRNDLGTTTLNAYRCLLQSISFGFAQSEMRPAPARLLENLLQCKDLLFRDESSHLAMSARVVAESVRSVDQRLKFYIELQTKAGDALFGPSPKGCFADAANDLRRLVDIVEAISIAIDKGPRLGHPRTQAEFPDESNFFVTEPDRGFCRNPHDQGDGFYE